MHASHQAVINWLLWLWTTFHDAVYFGAWYVWDRYWPGRRRARKVVKTADERLDVIEARLGIGKE